MLLAGPSGAGKTMLVHSICTELGATLFDLTATNIVGKYPGKSGLNMLLHLVIKVSKLMQPWEMLMDLGHVSNNSNYQLLTMVLQDFKDINESTMANTILHLAINNSGEEPCQTRIAVNAFKANKTGDALKEKSIDKTETIQWQADPNHYARAFRENFSSLNWSRVFESFSELDTEIEPDFKMD